MPVLNVFVRRELARRRGHETTYTLPIVFPAAFVSGFLEGKKQNPTNYSWEFKIALGKIVNAL